MNVSTPVRDEIMKRFPEDGPRLIELLASTELPFLGVPERARERDRVHLAILKHAGGDARAFAAGLGIAARDWRDLLMGTGLANADWPEVLRAAGYPVP